MNKGLVVAIIGLIAMMPSVGFCQEPAAPAAPEIEYEYSYGTVVSVNKDASELTISEYDWSNDTEANVAFAIDPNVTVENVAVWHEIPVGSEVDIEYLPQNGKKLAKSISVYTTEEVPMEPASEPADIAMPEEAAPPLESEAPAETAEPAPAEASTPAQ